MAVIALVSPNAMNMKAFVDTLSSQTGAEIEFVADISKVIDAIKAIKPLAVVIEDDQEDFSSLEMVRQILSFDAMIHIAMMSDSPEAEFHEKTEGYGILMQLPRDVDVKDARVLAERLSQL